MVYQALTLILLAAAHLHATTVERFSLSQLSAQAHRIVVATCTGRQTESLDGQIFTRYTFSVDETVKGNAQPHIELYLPGGTLEGVQSRIAGMPEFILQSEHVLFLTEQNHVGFAWPIGLGQGTFRIERTADNTARVYQRLDGLTLYEQTAKAAPTPSIQGSELHTFLQTVRTLAGDEPDAR